MVHGGDNNNTTHSQAEGGRHTRKYYARAWKSTHKLIAAVRHTCGGGLRRRTSGPNRAGRDAQDKCTQLQGGAKAGPRRASRHRGSRGGGRGQRSRRRRRRTWWPSPAPVALCSAPPSAHIPVVATLRTALTPLLVGGRGAAAQAPATATCDM